MYWRTNSQLNPVPITTHKRKKYLSKYGVEEDRKKRKELERFELPDRDPNRERRKRPPKYISNSAETQEIRVLPRGTETKFSFVQIGDDFPTYMPKGGITPQMPLKTRKIVNHRAVSVTRSREYHYDESKGLTWKYIGETDDGFGTTSRSVQVRVSHTYNPRAYSVNKCLPYDLSYTSRTEPNSTNIQTHNYLIT